MTNVIRPYGIRDKIGYMMGDFGCNMSFALISAVLLDFTTQYLGLDPLIWAAIIVVLKVWDGINDPLVGALIDSRKVGVGGKFKPFIKWGSFGLIVACAIMFIPIGAAPAWLRYVGITVGYLFWDFCYTVVNVPYGSLNSVITADPAQRAELSTLRSLGAMIAMIMLMALPLVLYKKNAEGHEVFLGDRVIWVALILGVLGFVAFQLLMRLTTERVKMPTAQKGKFNYFKVLKGFFKNTPVVAMCIASFFQLAFLMSSMQTSKYLFQFLFNDMKASVLGNVVTMLPMVFVIPLVKPLAKKFGKKEIASYPLLLSVVASIVMLLIPNSVWTSKAGMIVWIAGTFVVGLGGIFVNLVGWAMVADCIDYQQIQTGQRDEGTIYATYSMFRKIAQGISAAVVPILLVISGWPRDMVDKNPEQIKDLIVASDFNPLMMKDLSIVMLLIGAVAMAAVLIFMYKLDKKAVAEMTEELSKINEIELGTKNKDE